MSPWKAGADLYWGRCCWRQQQVNTDPAWPHPLPGRPSQADHGALPPPACRNHHRPLPPPAIPCVLTTSSPRSCDS